LGYDLKIDGKFGDKTKAAVVDFQKKNKLSQDGIVGTNTWTALNTVYGNATNTGINPGAMGMSITSNNYVSKKEKQKTSYNNKNCYGGEKIGSSNSFIKEAGSITASFIPILGDAKDVQEAVTGKDLITGEKLTKGQRVVTGVMMLLPIANGKAARETIEKVADSPIGKGIAKGADEVAERAKKVLDDVICFTGETLIASKYGYKFIKDIEVGDEVYSENPETGEKGLKKVKNIYVNETKELIHISIGETKIKATPSHPFWIIGKGWITAEKVKVGDKVKLSSGEEVEVTEVEKEILKDAVKVYNFEVEDWHTYYVSDKDVLVHNTCKSDPKDAIKGSVEAIGQVHHILTNKTMKALDDHPTLKGKFNREGPMFKYKAADVDAHKGYQQWHRDVDNTVVDWLQNNPKATEQQFKNFLNKLYQNPDISKRIPNVNIK
ncbi:MAG: polymorphic toxin-type HINT domain-containing protein, partial [Clostridium sp.]|nr:polymorphic toxin-type HINT domain-containing protein [Clostridium sp.]